MKTEIENLLRRIDTNSADPIELLLLPAAVQDANDAETDIAYARRLLRVAEVYNEDEFALAGRPWPFHCAPISRGAYPIEKLPAHVREIADGLYYGKATGAT